MNTISYEGRSLTIAEFGAGRRQKDSPTILVPSTEYRDTETLKDIYALSPSSVDIVVVDNTNLGSSDRVNYPLSTEEVLKELSFAIQKLSIREFILVGYCSTAEMALIGGEKLGALGVILQGPLLQPAGGYYLDYFYSVLKKAILDGDGYYLNAITNIIDPHSRGFREDRSWAMTRQFAKQAMLKDKEHFWLKTLQCRPRGEFLWEEIGQVPFPIRIIKGIHDGIQPTAWLQEKLNPELHDICLLDSGHQILTEQLPEVLRLMEEFVDKTLDVGVDNRAVAQ